MKSLLAAQLDRANRNLMMTGLGLIAGAAFLLIAGPRDLQRVYLEPDRATVESLARAIEQRTLTRTYFSVQGERVIDTGYIKVDKAVLSGRERETGRFVALASGDRLLLVKTPNVGSRPAFKGVLVPLADPVKDEILSELEEEYPNIKGRFLTVMLDASGIPLSSLSFFTAIVATLFLGSFFLHRGARGLEDPRQFGPLKDLGRRDEVDKTMEQIDFEWRTDPKRVHLGGAMLSHRWLVSTSLWKVDVMAVEEIAWVYKTARVPWALTSRRSLVLRARDGRRVDITGAEANIERLHDEIVFRAPWAVNGYNRSLEVLWTADRRAFLAEVTERRQNSSASG